jgi:hypothetical protein
MKPCLTKCGGCSVRRGLLARTESEGDNRGSIVALREVRVLGIIRRDVGECGRHQRRAAAVIPTRTTGQKALKEFLTYRIERTGKGIASDPFRYFVGAGPGSRRKSKKPRSPKRGNSDNPEGSKMTARALRL